MDKAKTILAKVNKEKCAYCGLCVDVCPVEAISIYSFTVEPEKCIGCEECIKSCPVGAIERIETD